MQVHKLKARRYVQYLLIRFLQYRKEGTLCRNADGNCDVEEYCTGDSPVVRFHLGDFLL